MVKAEMDDDTRDRFRTSGPAWLLAFCGNWLLPRWGALALLAVGVFYHRRHVGEKA